MIALTEHVKASGFRWSPNAADRFAGSEVVDVVVEGASRTTRVQVHRSPRGRSVQVHVNGDRVYP